MNKRKASNVTSIVKDSDMIFEDDDESITGDSAKGSASREVSRVSGRAKKTKAIFDPSDNNGPVHKRKKEAVEAEKIRSLPIKTKSATKLVKSPVPSPKKTAALAAAFQILSPSKVEKVEPKPVVESPKVKTVAAAKKRLSLDKKTVPDLVKSEVLAASLAKEPSKRIQARKQVKRPDGWASTAADKKQRPSSSSAGCLSDYDKASTVEFKEEGVPDVSRWTYQQVTQYFNGNLGFSKRDAAIFTDQEIDGEALKIMKRGDIVTTKFESLKFGTALKMWSHIIMFQTGELNDDSQKTF